MTKLTPASGSLLGATRLTILGEGKCLARYFCSLSAARFPFAFLLKQVVQNEVLSYAKYSFFCVQVAGSRAIASV